MSAIAVKIDVHMTSIYSHCVSGEGHEVRHHAHDLWQVYKVAVRGGRAVSE